MCVKCDGWLLNVVCKREYVSSKMCVREKHYVADAREGEWVGYKGYF